MDLITVQNLDVRLDKAHILRNLSFGIGPAERFAILGDQASHLTALSRVLLGLAPSNAHVMGRITMMGESLLELKERHWCSVRGGRIALVPRDVSSALTPTKAIGSQIEEHIYIHRPGQNAEEISRRLMRRVGLGHVPMHRTAEALSPEDRVGVSLAIALACSPRLLIFAYPTETLGRKRKNTLHTALKDISAEDDMGLLILTQDVMVAEELGERVLVMEDGEAVETVTSAQLFSGTRDAKTKARVAATRPLTAWPVLEEKPLLVDAKDLVAGQSSGGKRALDGVRFELQTGGRVGLMCDNPAERDVLVACLLGQRRPHKGVLRLNGQRVGRATRGQVQILRTPSPERFDPRQTVKTIIGAPLARLQTSSNKLLRTQRIEKAIRTWGLATDRANAFVGDLTEEELCRVALARAMVCNPALLILEHAFCHLSPMLRADMVALLAAHCDTTALIWISDDLPLLGAVTERLMTLEGGQIIKDEPTAEHIASLERGLGTRPVAIDAQVPRISG